MRIGSHLIVGLLVIVTCQRGGAAIIGVNEVGLGADGSMDWALLGPDLGTFGTNTGPLAVTGIPGLTVTGSQPNPDITRRVQGLSWGGNFANGANLIWTDNGGPLSLTFSSDIQGFGTQVQEQALLGVFTATLDAYDSLNNLLGSVVINGDSNNAADNSAVFIGAVSNNSTGIRRIVLSTVGPVFNDFAINDLRILSYQATAVPEPTSFALLGLSGLGSVIFAFRRRRQLVGSAGVDSTI